MVQKLEIRPELKSAQKLGRENPPFPLEAHEDNLIPEMALRVKMVEEGTITREEAVMRTKPEEVEQYLLRQFNPEDLRRASEEGRYLGRGTPGGGEAVSGLVALDSSIAEKLRRALPQNGREIILVRLDTTPATLVCQGIGITSVVGCETLQIDSERHLLHIDGTEIQGSYVDEKGNIITGDTISIDSTTGHILLGRIRLLEPTGMRPELNKLLEIADQVGGLGVWAIVDSPEKAKRARELGAKGVHCPTENMFFGPEPERRSLTLAALMARTSEERRPYLEELLLLQKEDFKRIFRAADGLPGVIRLFNRSIYELLPPLGELVREVTELRCKGGDSEELAKKEEVLRFVTEMRELNPGIGLRGYRIATRYPWLGKMQVKAIFEEVCQMAKKEGANVSPKIAIPFVSHVNELELAREMVEGIANQVMAEHEIDIDYQFGAMIETPRACFTADQLADHSDFIIFDTESLTEMTFGFSRRDVEKKFLDSYLERGILEENPFVILDPKGVGRFIEIGVRQAKAVKPDLEISVWGEHAGDPESIKFFHQVGLDHVSCSPHRVPVARLIAAQARITNELNLA